MRGAWIDQLWSAHKLSNEVYLGRYRPLKYSEVLWHGGLKRITASQIDIATLLHAATTLAPVPLSYVSCLYIQ